MKGEPEESSGLNSEDTDDVIIVGVPSKDVLTPLPIRTMGLLSLEDMGVLRAVPWMYDSWKACQADMGIGSLRSLEKLMRCYHKQVTPYVKDCYSRPNRAAKLKKNMSDAIMFFHLTCKDFKAPLEHSSYLAKMSDLVAMYMDMEIKSSRTGTESLPKIASKITSSLHVYFGESLDYILDTVLKSKIISKTFWELSDLIFRKVLRESPGSAVYIFSYIRYLLAFKMWKSIVKGADDRRQIVKLAILKLKPPDGFREKITSVGLRDILPRIPKSQLDITAFYMQAKFSVKDKAKIFLRAVVDPKLQCTLDRQSYCFNDVFSSLDDQDDNEGIMNDMWTSVNEPGFWDSISLPSFTGSENKKINKLNKSSGKSKGDHHLKKRRRKFEVAPTEIGEDDLPNVRDSSNCIKKEEPSDKEFEHEIHVTGDTMEIAAEVELPSVMAEENEATIKIEPQYAKPEESVPDYQTLWNDPNLQSYYSSSSYNYVPDTKNPEYVESVPNPAEGQLVVIPKDSEASIKETETLDINGQVCTISMDTVAHVQPQPEQVEVNEDFKDYYYKQMDTLNSENSSKPEVKETINGSSQYADVEENGVGVLHNQTISRDRSIYDLQMTVYSYSTKLNARTTISVLSRIFSDKSKIMMYRCGCAGCKNNLCVIRRNWKCVIARIVLDSNMIDNVESGDNKCTYTYENALDDLKAVGESDKNDVTYWENEFEALLKKIDDSIKDDSESSNLPLKKRKAFSYNNFNKDHKDREISYPCTPMISIAEIAELALKNGGPVVGPNNTPVNTNVAPTSYVPPISPYAPYTSSNPVPKYNSVIVQSAGKAVVVPTEQNLVPGAFTTTFLPDHQAQELKLSKAAPVVLKEFQQFNGAQGYISFVHTTGKTTTSEQNLVPGAFTTTFLPEHQVHDTKIKAPTDFNFIPEQQTEDMKASADLNFFQENQLHEQKVKFKTPAQLKEFQHLSAAQDLINFAHASRTYNKTQETVPEKQTRRKGRQSRKRKRT